MAGQTATLSRRGQAVAARTAFRVWGPYGVLVAALAFLGWYALTAISRPGLHYDESLFVHAALGGHYPGAGFVSDRFHGVVTMVMPYIGALKSWLYAPIFGVFGVSAATIRVPAIVALAITVCVAFALARRLFGPWLAALLAVLMATDPAYTAMARADSGPVVLSGLLRVGALAAYFAWRRTESVRYLWLLAAAVALGVFNKLDYVAFAAAFAVAVAVVDHRRVLALVRRRPLATALPVLALTAVAAVEYAEIYVPASVAAANRSHLHGWARVSEFWGIARSAMDGTVFYLFQTGTGLRGGGTPIVAVTVATLTLAAALVAWRLLRRRPATGSASGPLAEAAGVTGFFLALLLSLFVLLTATPEAVGAHHAMLMWPLPALLAVSVVSAAARLPRPWVRVAALVVLLGAGLWLTASQVRVAGVYRDAYRHGRTWNSVWSPEIYGLVRAVRQRAPEVDSVVTADWGIGNQLLALGDEAVRVRLDDNWPAFASDDPAAADQLVASVLRGHRTIVACHVRGAEAMAGAYDRLRAALARLAPARGIHELYRGRALVAYLVDDRTVRG
jgi:hypothetical protein